MLIDVWLDFERPGTAQIRFSHERGCKNDIFTEPGFLLLRGFILEASLDPKVRLDDQGESFGGPRGTKWDGKTGS